MLWVADTVESFAQHFLATCTMTRRAPGASLMASGPWPQLHACNSWTVKREELKNHKNERIIRIDKIRMRNNCKERLAEWIREKGGAAWLWDRSWTYFPLATVPEVPIERSSVTFDTETYASSSQEPFDRYGTWTWTTYDDVWRRSIERSQTGESYRSPGVENREIIWNDQPPESTSFYSKFQLQKP